MRGLYDDIRQQYAWFLGEIEHPEEIVKKLIAPEYRDITYTKGREFTKTVYRLLLKYAGDDTASLQYVMI
jgi:hypothetical protein